MDALFSMAGRAGNPKWETTRRATIGQGSELRVAGNPPSRFSRNDREKKTGAEHSVVIIVIRNVKIYQLSLKRSKEIQ